MVWVSVLIFVMVVICGGIEIWSLGLMMVRCVVISGLFVLNLNFFFLFVIIVYWVIFDLVLVVVGIVVSGGIWFFSGFFLFVVL